MLGSVRPTDRHGLRGGLAATSRGSTHPTARFHDRLSPRCARRGDRREEDSITVYPRSGGSSHARPVARRRSVCAARPHITKQRALAFCPLRLDALSMVVYIDRHRNRAVGAANMTHEQFHQVAKALANPQRFAILERIARERGELACKAPGSGVSHLAGDDLSSSERVIGSRVDRLPARGPVCFS